MEITNTTSKFEYRIEAKPDGSGFIAHPVGAPPANFPLGIIEGATREEVQEKIRAKIMEAVQEKIPTLFKFAGMNVAVNSTINVITKAAFKGASTIRRKSFHQAVSSIFPRRSSPPAAVEQCCECLRS